MSEALGIVHPDTVLSVCEPVKLKEQVMYYVKYIEGTGMGYQLDTFLFKRRESGRKKGVISPKQSYSLNRAKFLILMNS